MILNCPQCNARFLVADSLIPTDGRTVRCGACSHQWHVENPAGPTPINFKQLLEEETSATTVETEISQPTTSTPNVPAITKKKFSLTPFKIAVPVLAGIWAVLAVFTYFPKGVDSAGVGNIYRMLGVHSTAGLAFIDVKMEREELEGKTRFIVSGNITNHAQVMRTVPTVHVALKDKDRHAVWARDYPVNIPLKVGESYPFRIVNIETSFAANVKTITLDIGNSLELMTR
jgi:predicted Zn finger-like uncharacterized protein